MNRSNFFLVLLVIVIIICIVATVHALILAIVVAADVVVDPPPDVVDALLPKALVVVPGQLFGLPARQRRAVRAGEPPLGGPQLATLLHLQRRLPSEPEDPEHVVPAQRVRHGTR